MKKLTIGIIGGTGAMGRWMNRFFAESGYNILISGRKTKLTYSDLVAQSDVIILSTPLDAALRISEDIGPILTKDQLLMDVCSLKECILDGMLKSTSAQVIGTHPLFGPTVDSIRRQNVIICPGRGADWLSWLENEFQSRGGIVTRMDPSSHDKSMAFVQGLTHFITICVGRTLQKMKISPKEAMAFSTPIFRVKLDLVGRLFALDLDLYKNLIGKNRHTRDVLEAFIAAIGEGKEHLLSDQNENGIKYLEPIRDFLGPFCEEALKESNLFLNALYSET